MGTEATVKGDPPFIINSPEDTVEYVNICIYGDYGVGKTYLAGTSAAVESMGDILMISAEKGERTLKKVEDYNFKNIDIIRINDYNGIGRIFKFLQRHCELRDDDNLELLAENEAWLKQEEIKPANAKKYNTVIIDSLSEVDQFCLNQLLGITEKTGLDEETATAEWTEYKKNSGMMRRLVRQFRDLPINVIFICGRIYEKDELSRFNYMPAMTGALKGHIQGFMDIVGFLVTAKVTENEEIQRKLYVQPVGKFSAKCRFSTYKGASFDNPTMGKIMSSIGL